VCWQRIEDTGFEAFGQFARESGKISPRKKVIHIGGNTTGRECVCGMWTAECGI